MPQWPLSESESESECILKYKLDEVFIIAYLEDGKGPSHHIPYRKRQEMSEGGKWFISDMFIINKLAKCFYAFIVATGE